MNSHFLDIDDILTTEQLVSCTFQINVAGLGHLNQSAEEPDLKKGTKLELPMWLAQKLKNDERKIVTTTVPKAYCEQYRDMYKADPEAVNLQALGPYFYHLSTKMSLLDSTQSKAIAACSLELYQKRFRAIMDSALNATYREKKECTERFDNVELKLFEKGQDSLLAFTKWENRESEKLTAADVVTRNRKRKRDTMDE